VDAHSLCAAATEFYPLYHRLLFGPLGGGAPEHVRRAGPVQSCPL
jgi:hypothetical protein